MFKRIKKAVVRMTLNLAKESVVEMVGESLDRSLKYYREKVDLEGADPPSIEEYHAFLENRLEKEIDEYFEEMR